MRPMQSRLRSRAGLAQLTMVATIGICLGVIAGFMFMSVVDTVSVTPSLATLQSIKLIRCNFQLLFPRFLSAEQALKCKTSNFLEARPA